MFYRPGLDPHGLPHNPWKGCITPRPIGWISTLSKEGVANLAPFSFFNGVASEPPMVVFACNGLSSSSGFKDTRQNCETQGEFVVNVATYELRDQLVATSAPVATEVDEFELAGLKKAACTLVSPSRVAASPIALECLYHQTVELPGEHNTLILGRVVGIHIDERVLTEGQIDVEKLRPLARMGYQDYCSVDTVFSLLRPKA